MFKRGFTLAHTPALVIASLLVLLFGAACGGGPSPAGSAATTGPTVATGAPGAATEAAGATTEAPAAGTSGVAAATAATSAPEMAAAATVQPTGVPEIACQPNQKPLVWMVRNSLVENSWETQIVRPAFQKAHPDICLKILSLNQEDVAVKREAMIASGELLHVFSSNWGGNGFTNDRVRGLIEDLTPFIQRDNFDLSAFLPDALKTYQFEGKTWGLPLLATGSYIYYNMKLFDEAKVPYPPVDWNDKSWTWEKFVDTAKKLTKNVEDINKAQYGAAPDVINGNLEFPPMLWGHDIFPPDAFQKGYPGKINVTDPKSIQAYQAFHDLVFVDKVAPDPAASQALNQLGGAFAAGRVAMQMTGGWGHWVYKSLIDDPKGFCWGAAPFPMGSPDAKIRSMTFTDPWVMTRNLKPEDQTLAWTFLKFLVSPEQAAAYSKVTGTPPTQKALLDDYYKQFSKCMKPADMKKVFEGAFTNGRPGSASQFVRADQLLQVWNNNLSAFFSDPNAKAEPVLQAIQQQTISASNQIQADIEKMKK